jgi:hypothetical protein
MPGPTSWLDDGDDDVVRSSAVHFESSRHTLSHVDEGARFLKQHGSQELAIRYIFIEKK